MMLCLSAPEAEKDELVPEPLQLADEKLDSVTYDWLYNDNVLKVDTPEV